MSWIKKILNNVYIQQIFMAGIGALILIFIISILLNIFTRHGETRAVPDFRLLTLDEASALADENEMRLEVIDSVFLFEQPRGTVYEQMPKKGTGVKTNRKIFLTMNALAPKKSPVPDVEGMSLRQAKSVLLSSKFRVSSLTYRPDMATNYVIEQRLGTERISKGVMLPEGSELNLIVGLDSVAVRLPIPDVKGKKMYAAQDELVNNSLNFALYFDKDVTNMVDSMSAKVYRQDPPSSRDNIVVHGTTIKLYLKK